MQPEKSSPSVWPAPGSGIYGLLGRTLTHPQRSSNCTGFQPAYQPSHGANPNFLRTPFWIASVLPPSVRNPCSLADVSEALKESGRSTTASATGHRVRNILVTSELALA